MGKKVYVFIDYANLWQTQKSKGSMLAFDKLKLYLKKEFDADELKVYLYTAYPAEGTRDYSLDSRHKFFTYLSKGLNFIVRKKPLKRITIHEEAGDRVEEKGNMDVEMTIDVVSQLKKYDIAILFTGDSDFLSLITYVKNAGKKAFIFSSKNNVSSELRTGGDGYTDILEISEDIWRDNLIRRTSK